MKRRSVLIVMMMGVWVSPGLGAVVFSDNFSDESLSQWSANQVGYIGTYARVEEGNLVLDPPAGAGQDIWWIQLDSGASFTDVGRYELTWRQWHSIAQAEHRGRVYMRLPGGFSMSWWDWGNPGEAYFTAPSGPIFLGSLHNGSNQTWATFKVVMQPVGGSTRFIVYKNDELILDQTVSEPPNFTDYNKITFYTHHGVAAPTRIDDVQLTIEQYSLQGVVVLDNYLGDLDAVGVKFVLEPTEGGDNITRSVMLTSDGVFTIPQLPSGTYNLYAKAYASLRTVLTNVSITGFPTVLTQPIILTGDDINGDNVVSFEDFSILQNSYGQSGAVAVNPAAAVAAANGCGLLGILLMTLLATAAVGLSLRSEK